MLYKLYSKKANYYEHIDGIRAIAVLAVLLCHLDISTFSGGYIGVDVFFVISGFLITQLIYKELQQTNNFNFLNFYVRRIRRIAPALFVVLGVTFIGAVWLLNVIQFHEFGKFLSSTVLSISNIIFYKKSGYFDISSQYNSVLHTWSLSIEEQFYIVLPITLLIFYRFVSQKKNNIMIFIGVIALISFMANYIHIYNSKKNSVAALYFLLYFRIFEFCIGSLTVFLVNYKLRPYQKEIVSLIGLGLISYAVFFFTDITPFPLHNALFPTIGTALLIWAGDTKYIGSLLKNMPARFTGLISYSLYLVHWPLVVFWKIYKENTGGEFNLNSYEKKYIFFLSIILAVLSYFYIEQRFRKNTPKTKKGKIKDVKIFLTIVAIFCAIGQWVYKDTAFWGWRSMYPEIIKKHDIRDFHINNWGGAGYNGGNVYKANHQNSAIIMMGDSHSGMLNEGVVEKIAKPHGINIFTASGGGAGKYVSCLLLPGLSRQSKQITQNIADDHSKKAHIEAVNELKKYKKSIFMFSAGYRMQLAQAVELKNHKPLSIDVNKTNNYKCYKKFIDALDCLREKLKGRKLVLIGAYPGGRDFNPLKCYSRLKWFPKNGKCKNKTPIADTLIGFRNINTVLRQYSEQRPNVYFINPFDFMCEKGECHNIDQDGNPMYSDGAHLSKKGSKYFMQKVAPKILKILNDKTKKHTEKLDNGNVAR